MMGKRILLDHGSGGRASSELIRQVFLRHLGNPTLNLLEDAAALELDSGRLALSTDGYVVDPLFFPGGDIGSLAVHGTINDLAMRGARPKALAAGFILEEGLEVAELDRVVASMAKAAEEAGVMIVAGDTKVVGRGAADKMFITTTGIGTIPEGRKVSIYLARPGDAVIVSGPLGEHGLAILAERRALAFEAPIVSDSAALNGLVEELAQALGPDLHALRDPTRGGLASILNEIAQASQTGIEIDEPALPIKPAVLAACELLGLDPLYLANEGKLAAVVEGRAASLALKALQAHPLGREAAIIGRVVGDHPGRVAAQTGVGGRRLVDVPLGEPLPRIC